MHGGRQARQARNVDGPIAVVVLEAAGGSHRERLACAALEVALVVAAAQVEAGARVDRGEELGVPLPAAPCEPRAEGS